MADIDIVVVDDITPADRAARTALARAAAGELLGPADIAAIWRISQSQFYRRHGRGEFDAFKVRPAIGLRCYSGTLVHRYVTGAAAVHDSVITRRNVRRG